MAFSLLRPLYFYPWPVGKIKLFYEYGFNIWMILFSKSPSDFMSLPLIFSFSMKSINQAISFARDNFKPVEKSASLPTLSKKSTSSRFKKVTTRCIGSLKESSSVFLMAFNKKPRQTFAGAKLKNPKANFRVFIFPFGSPAIP